MRIHIPQTKTCEIQQKPCIQGNYDFECIYQYMNVGWNQQAKHPLKVNTKQQIKPRISRKMEMINTRAETSKIKQT